MEFPFEKLYKKLAEPLAQISPKTKDFGFTPCVLFVTVEDDEEIKTAYLDASISSALLGMAGPEQTHDLFESMVGGSAEKHAIVMITKGMIKTMKNTGDYTQEEITEYVKTLTPDDPGFKDCMVIAIHHKSGLKMIHLPISEDGCIEVIEFEKAVSSAQFVPVSEEEAEAAKTKH
jgi:hypothetical protein